MKCMRLIPILALGMGLALGGCITHTGVQGSGVSKTEKRELPAFKSIETQGAYDVEVTCQRPGSFEIEGDDNIIPLIQTEVRDGVLYVTSKNSTTSKTVSLRVALPDLAAITSTGAGKINVVGVKNDKFEVHSTGAAKVTATGQTKAAVITSTGAGEIDAHDLHAEKADVNIVGAARADVYATEQLDVSITGAGKVSYSGKPKVINKNIGIAGALSARD
jgi:hypothetical protein